MALLPLLCCEIYCLLEGHHITDIYLPASSWNDELFYYKQVESIVKYGYPYGYFGFNESYARVLSFAAWSPVLLWPWILWGLIFGWNLMSPIYCNIFVMMIAFFLFAWLVQTDWKQCTGVAVLCAVFPLFSRYTMSAMAESTCFAMLIVFWGVAYSYYQKESMGKLTGMFIISVIMTLMRPYLIIFLTLPMLILIWKKKWKGLIGSLGIATATVIMYACIKYFLSAYYFTSLYDMSWITNFLRYGFGEGLRMLVEKFISSLANFWVYCQQGLTQGLMTGTFMIIFMVILVLLIVYEGYCFRKKEWKETILYGHLIFSFVAMWIALLLMYKIQESGRHLLAFIVLGFFALSMMKLKGHWQIFLSGAVVIYLYFFTVLNTDDYELGFATDELVQTIEQTREILEENLTLQTEEAPNFDNDVIWVLADYDSGEENWLVTDYQLLYSLPAGFGISCCDAEYVLSSFDELQSKYICTVLGGQIDELCQERGLTVVAKGLNAVIYQLR
ncbi:MAG: hypothetical protein LUH58_04525 [Lachnospiraceae bacterium]|nr:hypothetical protein [Lachnospiraceae bacterium]